MCNLRGVDATPGGTNHLNFALSVLAFGGELTVNRGDMKNSKLTLVAFATLAAFAIGHVASAEDQPKMRAALEQLKISRDLLRAAPADKGGHRRKAMDLVDAAIAEVEKGIEFKDETRK